MSINENEPIEAAADQEKKVFVAGQWQLFWWKFKRHRLALFSLCVVLSLYLVALTAEFVAPFDPNAEKTRYTYAPMQRLHLFDEAEGKTVFRPHVQGLKSKVDPIAARRTYELDPAKKIPIGIWVKTDPYKLAGLIPMGHRLFGPLNQRDPMYLLGADRLGRDMLSRVIHGARVSLSIGLVGVIMSLFLGILLGGLSGYYGGSVDTVIQRGIEFLRSIPTIPLWMGLAAAVPLSWPPLRTYFIITLIVSLLGWTSLAREVRGKFLSLRNEDFIVAARLDGMSEIGIIFKHMVPSFLSHIGNQIAEAIRLHNKVGAAEAKDRAVSVLKRVGIPNAADRLGVYPFQLSGGMRQRAMIALALSCNPDLLIADEPTTALDVTTQAQILDLMRDLQQEKGMAMMFSTHDLGVVAEIADRVAVMYLGQVVETAAVDDVFHNPKHPYTRALLESIPKIGVRADRAPGTPSVRSRLLSIRGMVPHPFAKPDGCPFNTRCDEAMPCCRTQNPGVTDFGGGHSARCHLYEPIAAESGERHG